MNESRIKQSDINLISVLAHSEHWQCNRGPNGLHFGRYVLTASSLLRRSSQVWQFVTSDINDCKNKLSLLTIASVCQPNNTQHSFVDSLHSLLTQFSVSPHWLPNCEKWFSSFSSAVKLFSGHTFAYRLNQHFRDYTRSMCWMSFSSVQVSLSQGSHCPAGALTSAERWFRAVPARDLR